MMKKIMYMILFCLYSGSTLASTNFTLGKLTLQVDEVTTPAAQERGLSGRPSLGPNQGMLFIFPKEGFYSIWMKDMLFPIDIIWLDNNGQIVYVIENAKPCTFFSCPIYKPAVPARYVLEAVPGTFKRLQQ